MHQHIRSAPRSSSAASNPTTNPERTNNARDQPPQRTRSSVDLASYTERIGGDAGGPRVRSGSSAASSSGQERELNKLNQIIQHFHTKAALMICSARASLPPSYNRNGESRQDRWFNIVSDDTDVLLDDLREWKRSDVSDNKPPPLVVEVYLDTAHLRENQALVIIDDSGKRWDVSDALAGSADSSPRPPTKSGGKYYEVVLERWTIELGDSEGCSRDQLNDQLPNVYKKGVVLFRSLFTYLRFLPAWKLYRRFGRQPGTQSGLRLKYRIRRGRGLPHGQKDTLSTPLCPSEADIAAGATSSPTGVDESAVSLTHHFDTLPCPSGLLRITCTYRRNQDFAAVDAEALLSSRFIGLDEGLPTLAAGRSLPLSRTQQAATSPQTRSKTQYGSAQASSSSSRLTNTKPTTARLPRALLGAYGSLNTFHATGRRESPLSALQRRQEEDSEDSDMEGAPKLTEEEIQKRYQERRRSGMGLQNVFKAGSMADATPVPAPPGGRPDPRARVGMVAYSAPASRDQRVVDPRNGRLRNKRSLTAETEVLPPSASAEDFARNVEAEQASIRDIGRTDRLSSDSSRRVTLNTLPQYAARHRAPNETAIASSGSSSPRPAPPQRYTSSFANRTRRPTSIISQAGRSGGSNEGSGGSEAARDSSSAAKSGEVDDDTTSLQSFIGDLQSAAVRNHTLMRRSPTTHTVDLGRYREMREPSASLADDMAGSLTLASSGTPPSRRLSNVPGLSTSSSPGSRAQYMGHAPHVRSRLSTQSIGARPQEEGTEEEDEPCFFPAEDV